MKNTWIKPILILFFIMSDHLRGHPIECKDGQFIYCDTGEPTVGNPRDCGYCGKPNTPEGHDGCLETLPGVMNACCGHGSAEDAYVQYSKKKAVYRQKAVLHIKALKAYWFIRSLSSKK